MGGFGTNGGALNASDVRVGVLAGVSGLLVGFLLGSLQAPLIEVDVMALPPGPWHGCGCSSTSGG